MQLGKASNGIRLREYIFKFPLEPIITGDLFCFSFQLATLNCFRRKSKTIFLQPYYCTSPSLVFIYSSDTIKACTMYEFHNYTDTLKLRTEKRAVN